MKNIAIAVVVGLILSGAARPVIAADAASKTATKGAWGSWFKDLKNTLAQSAVGGERKRGRTATSVAAVRGKNQKNMADPNEPSLKGDFKAEKAKKMQAYDDEFGVSVDLVSKGKLDEALKGFEAFKVSHPKHRVEDVDKAIEGVKAMMAENAAAADAKE